MFPMLVPLWVDKLASCGLMLTQISFVLVNLEKGSQRTYLVALEGILILIKYGEGLEEDLLV